MDEHYPNDPPVHYTTVYHFLASIYNSDTSTQIGLVLTQNQHHFTSLIPFIISVSIKLITITDTRSNDAPLNLEIMGLALRLQHTLSSIFQPFKNAFDSQLHYETTIP